MTERRVRPFIVRAVPKTCVGGGPNPAYEESLRRGDHSGENWLDVFNKALESRAKENLAEQSRRITPRSMSREINAILGKMLESPNGQA